MPAVPKPQQVTPEMDATLREFSGYGIKRAFNAVQTDLNATLAPLGLRMLTFSALVIVVDNPGLRQARLAEALSIERPNLVAVVDELEKKGLIARAPDPTDRRAQVLTATEEGRALYEAALAAVRAHEARMTQALSQEERQTLIHLARRIETGRQGGGDDRNG